MSMTSHWLYTLFFFSSRRRHTRYWRDWSSDVCSSDLGMPYRNADGFTDFESLELLNTESIEVYKGGNALRYGGSTLGGAINLETKTGYTATPLGVVAEGGSFGYLKTQVSSGSTIGRLDYFGSYTRTTLDGYRDYAGQGRDRINGHLGYVLSENTDLRAFYFFAQV